MRLCQLRSFVKVEYDNTSPAVVARETSLNEESGGVRSAKRRKAPTAECEFCQERLDVRVD